MASILILVCLLVILCTIPGYAAYEAFVYDRKFKHGIFAIVLTIVGALVAFGLWGQAKESISFSSKCKKANGIVHEGQCFNKNAVITIER